MTLVELSFALTLGLISGLDCVQMCGPIALVIGAGRPLILYTAGWKEFGFRGECVSVAARNPKVLYS